MNSEQCLELMYQGERTVQNVIDQNRMGNIFKFHIYGYFCNGCVEHVKGVDKYSGCYRGSLFTIQVVPRSRFSPLSHCQVAESKQTKFLQGHGVLIQG